MHSSAGGSGHPDQIDLKWAQTGLHGGEWTEAASFFTTPGYCDERMHLFVARGLERGEPQPDASEELEGVFKRADRA